VRSRPPDGANGARPHPAHRAGLRPSAIHGAALFSSVARCISASRTHCLPSAGFLRLGLCKRSSVEPIGERFKLAVASRQRAATVSNFSCPFGPRFVQAPHQVPPRSPCPRRDHLALVVQHVFCKNIQPRFSSPTIRFLGTFIIGKRRFAEHGRTGNQLIGRFRTPFVVPCRFSRRKCRYAWMHHVSAISRKNQVGVVGKEFQIFLAFHSQWSALSSPLAGHWPDRTTRPGFE